MDLSKIADRIVQNTLFQNAITACIVRAAQHDPAPDDGTRGRAGPAGEGVVQANPSLVVFGMRAA